MPTINEVLVSGPRTVKQIALETQLSESRVREVIKNLGDKIETRKDGASAAEFWMEPEEGRDETPTAPAIHAVEDLGSQTSPTCPMCGSSSTQEPAGEEGTYMGAFLKCPECKKVYHSMTGKELEIPETRKAKRVPLNPQYKINAKVAAVTEAGGTLTYDKATRLWTVALGDNTREMTAKEFSEETPETIVK